MASEEEHPTVRIAQSLEVIEECLQHVIKLLSQIAYPPIVCTGNVGDISDIKPGEVRFVPYKGTFAK